MDLTLKGNWYATQQLKRAVQTKLDQVIKKPGHGVLGRQIPLIKQHNRNCKSIQIVHTAPEELGTYKTYTDAISKGTLNLLVRKLRDEYYN